MATKPRAKAAAAVGVLQSRDEVIDAIARIGVHMRERARIEVSMNDVIAMMKRDYEEQAAPHAKAILDLTAGVQAWCEAHRMELTQGGKTKTAILPTGEVKWRTTPPSIGIKGVDAVMALLVERGLDRFMRTKVEPNKEAMLNEPDVAATVPGVTLKQTEDFVIEPFETRLEAVA